ncbi:MAG: 2-C-methyl-D-erythritol 4-phosphate cytidylyltransferase [Rikenellaceae bacterium]
MECRIEPKVGVVIVAGGKGLRVGGELPKQFRILGQAPLLVHSINNLAKGLHPSKVVVVLPQSHIEYWANLSSRFDVAEHTVVIGGAERFDSVKAGLESLGEDCDIIAIHDGVRPLSSETMLARCLACAVEFGSAIPSIPISDSVRVVNDDNSQPLDRSKLRAIQTPQIFDAVILRRAYNRCSYNQELTDDASVVEASGVSVKLCEGEKRNIKITTIEDLLYAQMIFEGADD